MAENTPALSVVWREGSIPGVAQFGEQGRFWCRQCGRSGNTITLLRDLRGITYEAARQELDGAGYPMRPAASNSNLPVSQHAINNKQGALLPPTKTWRSRAWALTEESITLLWSNQGKRARSWLKARGLTDRTMHFASLGYNPKTGVSHPKRWGLDQEHDVYIPRGITIPWMIKSDIWRFNVRRPAGTPRYIGPAGSSNGLYNVDDIESNAPVVLVEGEIDALSVMQVAGIAAVATGSSSGSRRHRWFLELMKASDVLIAFDSDDAGEKASEFWFEALPNSKRTPSLLG